ncbi:MAG: hypothetical protein N2559_16055 [Anaerolineae bacterium]|nr:hypothetical protein [Anaerolineae bacterium]
MRAGVTEDEGFSIGDLRLAVQSAIENRQSAINNWSSVIRRPSSVCGLRSAVEQGEDSCPKLS